MNLYLLQNYLGEKIAMKKVSAKNLGQHFLNETSMAKNIVKQLEFKNKDLLEIGPGMGILIRIYITKT